MIKAKDGKNTVIIESVAERNGVPHGDIKKDFFCDFCRVIGKEKGSAKVWKSHIRKADVCITLQCKGEFDRVFYTCARHWRQCTKITTDEKATLFGYRYLARLFDISLINEAGATSQ